jgi:hypothetical protein
MFTFEVQVEMAGSARRADRAYYTSDGRLNGTL